MATEGISLSKSLLRIFGTFSWDIEKNDSYYLALNELEMTKKICLPQDAVLGVKDQGFPSKSPYLPPHLRGKTHDEKSAPRSEYDQHFLIRPCFHRFCPVKLLALATAPDLNLPATMLPDSLAQAVVVSVVDTAAAAAVGATTITGTLVDHLSEMAIVTGSRARITTVPNLR